MTPETSRLIAETLRLDGEATKGPWVYVRPGRVESAETGLSLAFCGAASRHTKSGSVRTTEDDRELNAQSMAFYRTSAPRLARMLEVAVKALDDAALRYGEPESRRALAEIEKIAKGEPNGSER